MSSPTYLPHYYIIIIIIIIIIITVIFYKEPIKYNLLLRKLEIKKYKAY
jgi:hypothetical protein